MPDLTTNYQFPIPLNAETEFNMPSMWRDPITAIDAKIKSEMLDKIKAYVQGSGNTVLHGDACGVVLRSGWGYANGTQADFNAAIRNGFVSIYVYFKRTGANITFPADGDVANQVIADTLDARFRPEATTAQAVTGSSHGVMMQGWSQYTGGANPTTFGVSNGLANFVLNTNEVFSWHSTYATELAY